MNGQVARERGERCGEESVLAWRGAGPAATEEARGVGARCDGGGMTEAEGRERRRAAWALDVPSQLANT